MDPLEIKVREAIADNFAERTRLNYPEIVRVDEILLENVGKAVKESLLGLEPKVIQEEIDFKLLYIIEDYMSNFFTLEKTLKKIKEFWVHNEKYFRSISEARKRAILQDQKRLGASPITRFVTSLQQATEETYKKAIEREIRFSESRSRIVHTLIGSLRDSQQISEELIFEAIRRTYSRQEYLERFRIDEKDITTAYLQTLLPDKIRSIISEAMFIHFNNGFLEKDCEAIFQ